MSIVRSSIERNSARKMLKDPPKLLLGDVLIKVSQCYQQPGLVLCTKCARELKRCSFQPRWMPMEKGKGKSKEQPVPKLEERECPLKCCKIEVVVPVQSVRDSIAQIKGIVSELWYYIAVAESTRASLACLVMMWQAELESLKDSSEAEDLGMLVSDDFLPNE
ncbi:hypothetical protein HETIRDRAFT_119256 [Heterobasidion irregulare TC 32-1]|uniref:Uncharacterized protein n=1 Tax=Heterobasidion irregulare (strain TC 32-1) TaxID=747525 RepID=W4JSZ3_HETIT|nr:uncharacterized protein HETIRDRAFT_119256 [Heterobasidion irregulare TC 32-1]ETW75986.1 hypothetical protein HETIRDRAFT_119256 [Heterobasidion irregulare TC 32-1]